MPHGIDSVETAHTPSQYTLDLSLAYTLTPNTQVDAATYVGLNNAAPDLIVMWACPSGSDRRLI